MLLCLASSNERTNAGALQVSLRARAIAVIVALLALAAALVVTKKRSSSGPVLEEREAVVPWCATGLEPIAGGGCFAFSPPVEERQARPKSGGPALLLYLHGMYDDPHAEEELDRQSRVAKRAAARGLSVLALRGKKGECTAAEKAEWYCWPSNEKNAEDAKSFVEAWAPALEEAERRAGKPVRYVLGFSNGGYFAGLLAVRALFEAEAFAIVGAGSVQPVRAYGDKRPIFLLTADDDLSQEGMLAFGDELTRERWPHDTWSREGGHQLVDADIDAALTFFARVRKEKLPLSPPISQHVPRARDPRRRVDAMAASPSAEAPAEAAPLTAPEAEPEPQIPSSEDE
jgi:predicted esterase